MFDAKMNDIMFALFATLCGITIGIEIAEIFAKVCN